MNLRYLGLRNLGLRNLGLTAAIATLAGGLSAQTTSPCLGSQAFFGTSWSNGSYTVGGQTPTWQIDTTLPNWDVACIDNQSNIPAIWNNDCWIGCRRHQFFMKGRGASNDNDSIGFVLGYCAGDNTNPNANYLAVIWNAGDVTATVPGCAGSGTHPIGMRLVRVFGIPDPQEFWSQSNLNLPCSGPNSGVEVIATALTRGSVAWPRFAVQSFRVELEPDSLKIWCNNTVEFDLTGDYSPYIRGCFGYFSQGSHVDFWDLSTTSLNPVVANSSSYGQGVAGCNGVPGLRMLNRPINGTSPQILIENNTTQSHTGALLWGIAPDNVFFPFLGGSILIEQPLASVDTYTVPPGGFIFACTILDDSCQNGIDFYAQWICPDTCAPGGWALSQGLRIELGDL